MDALRAVAACLENLESIGPAVTEAHELSVIEPKLFDGHRLRTVPNSVPLIWIESETAFRKTIMETLRCKSETLAKCWTDLLATEGALANSLNLHAFPNRLSKEDATQRNLVFVSKHLGSFISKTPTFYEYAQVSEEWAKFFSELRDTKTLIADLPKRCLREGRVLAVEQISGMPRLVHPSEWLHPIGREKQQTCRFLLTTVLSNLIAEARPGPRNRQDRLTKKTAVSWLEDLYARLEPMGKRPTKADTLRQIQVRFKIESKTMLHEIWSEAAIEGWRSGGRQKASQRYSFDK